MNAVKDAIKSGRTVVGTTVTPEDARKHNDAPRHVPHQAMWRMPAVTISTRYVFFASMDVRPEAEALFNEVYDTEHVPNLLQVPGVRSVTRMKGEPARFAIAGGVRELAAPSPIYTAIYEIDDPQVLQSPQWAEAVERGRWPNEVRPHTSNRQHLLFKVQ